MDAGKSEQPGGVSRRPRPVVIVKDYILTPGCKLSPSARLVALAVADRMNGAGESFPGYEDIARRTGVSQRHVGACLRELCCGERPLFSRRFDKGHGRKCYRYTLMVSSGTGCRFNSSPSGNKFRIGAPNTELISGGFRSPVPVESGTECPRISSGNQPREPGRDTAPPVIEATKNLDSTERPRGIPSQTAPPGCDELGGRPDREPEGEVSGQPGESDCADACAPHDGPELTDARHPLLLIAEVYEQRRRERMGTG